MGIKNGLILIQALYDLKGDYFVYEMAYRFTGEQHYRLVEKQHGISLSEMMLADAVGEDISEFDNSFLDDTAFIKPAINLSVILKPGVIAEINGLDEVLKIDEVISYNITHSKGDAVSPSGDYSQIFLRVNMVAESYDALRAAVRRVAELLGVKSTDGSDMILSRFELPAKGY